jgi:superfamily I DNA/RNA helicase
MHVNQVFNYQQYLKFGHEYGYDLRGKSYYSEDSTTWGLTEDDVRFRTMIIKDALLEDKHFYDEEDILHEMSHNYEKYKAKYRLLDFTDMLTQAYMKYLPGFDLLAVDEIQDMSKIQLNLINRMTASSVISIYAGDDDQMISEWAGVDRKFFHQFIKGCEIEYLMNYRRFGHSMAVRARFHTNRFKDWKLINQVDYTMMK